MWNVYNHHIGTSDAVGFVRPPGANLAIFQDLREGKGVVIAYADRESEKDITVGLPDFGSPLVAEDIMGNAAKAPRELVLSKTGRPVILYTANKTPGRDFLAKLEPLDRRHAGFVSGGGGNFTLPPVWEGSAESSSDGSVALADGKPVWKLEQLWPDDWTKRENFKPMVWKGTEWRAKEGDFGGQPAAHLKDGTLIFGTRAPHGPGNDRHLRTAGLTFVAPEAGAYQLHGSAACHMWDSGNKTTVQVLRKSPAGVEKVGSYVIANNATVTIDGKPIDLAAGDELTLLPQIDGMFAGGDCSFKDLGISRGGSAVVPAAR